MADGGAWTGADPTTGDATAMHGLDRELAGAVFDAALGRLAADPPPLGGDLTTAPVPAITPGGLGGERALALLRDAILPATIAIDHPRYFAFIPGTPAPAAALADLLVSAYNAYGGSWLEGAGAVHAENEALRWLADLAGFPDGAGGCFVQGGTNGNLSALHAARERARHAAAAAGRAPAPPAAGAAGRAPAPPARGPAGRVAVSEEVHSSVRSMLRVMDVGTLEVPGDRLTGEALRAVLTDDELAARLARRGRETILARHTCAHRVDELMQVHAELAGEEVAA